MTMMDFFTNLSSPAWTNAIGSAGAFLTTISFIPQVWHSFKTRDVSGVSLGMYSVFAVGIALWLLYGFLLRAWPVVIANAVTLVLALAILGMKIAFGGRVSKAAQGVEPL